MEKKSGARIRVCVWDKAGTMAAVWNSAIRVGEVRKMRFEQTPQGDSQADFWSRSILGQEST